MTHKRLLLIEDDLILGESLVQRFELEGVQVRWARRLVEAQLQVNGDWGAFICDVRLPDGLSTPWFCQLNNSTRARPWFFLTGYGSVNDAVQALQAGARDYLTKPFDTEHLVGSVMSVLAHSATPEVGVLGISPAMRRIESLVARVARQLTSVLIEGESGVGKEVVAQLIHRLDVRRPKGDFVAVNCAAIPENLMEAEFFGYEKGAFTGAQRAHKGYVERADGGTLFLDEVGDLPPAMQAKLLRVLQERSFFRLGSERPLHSAFRVVAATNRDLYADMLSARFREDLYYRLCVVRLSIPPLRERPDDIRWLVERILTQITAETGRPIAVSEAYMRDLIARNWRGNVRELRAYLEHAVVLSDNGVLDVGEFTETSDEMSPMAGDTLAPLQDAVEDAERIHIRKALALCGNNMTKTAEMLNISRKTLWEKMKRLNLKVE
ncbi:MAG: sigma-54 dependent transcriptional regulator [Rhodoferax sp.]